MFHVFRSDRNPALIALLVLSVSLAGCGGGGGTSAKNPDRNIMPDPAQAANTGLEGTAGQKKK